MIDNKIEITVKINKKDISKEVYFLDNYDGNYFVGEHHHDFLKELNDTNVDLFINDIQYKYKKFVIPKKN